MYDVKVVLPFVVGRDRHEVLFLCDDVPTFDLLVVWSKERTTSPLVEVCVFVEEELAHCWVFVYDRHVKTVFTCNDLDMAAS